MKALFIASCFILMAVFKVFAQTSTNSQIVDDVFIPSDEDRDKLKEINDKFILKMQECSVPTTSAREGKQRVLEVKRVHFQRDSSMRQLFGPKNYALYKSQTEVSKAKDDSVKSICQKKVKGYSRKLKLNQQQETELQVLFLDYQEQKKKAVLLAENIADAKAKIADLKNAYFEKVKGILPVDKFEALKKL